MIDSPQARTNRTTYLARLPWLARSRISFSIFIHVTSTQFFIPDRTGRWDRHWVPKRRLLNFRRRGNSQKNTNYKSQSCLINYKYLVARKITRNTSSFVICVVCLYRSKRSLDPLLRMLRHVDSQIFTDVLKRHSTVIFSVRLSRAALGNRSLLWQL